MKVDFHRKFKKKYSKLRKTEKDKFNERLEIFIKTPNDKILHNHPLKGGKRGLFSINITGDLRAIYSFKKKGVVVFRDIDTHSNLYG